jgi:hypothetical protein
MTQLLAAAGTDTAVYSGAEANYLVLNNGDGSFTITDTLGDEGSDTLIGIEQLQFSDGTSIL